VTSDGCWENLHRELRKAGHCGASFPKIEIARNIARYMQPEANRSPSFRIFLEGIEALCAGEAA